MDNTPRVVEITDLSRKDDRVRIIRSETPIAYINT